MIEPTAENTIIAAAIALVGLLLFVVCAVARKDESCDPERDCATCDRSDKPTVGKCSECCQAFPQFPNWKPRQK